MPGENSIQQEIENLRLLYKTDQSKLLDDMMEFMLEEKKKQLNESAPSFVVEPKLPEHYSQEEIDELWEKIKGELLNTPHESWGMLSKDEHDFDPPVPLKVWKKPYSPLRSDLRYCLADLCLGFLNTSETPLSLELDIFSYGPKEKKQVLIPPKSISSIDPIWLSKHFFSDFRLLNPSHENFFILYSWFPSSGKMIKHTTPDFRF